MKKLALLKYDNGKETLHNISGLDIDYVLSFVGKKFSDTEIIWNKKHRRYSDIISDEYTCTGVVIL